MNNLLRGPQLARVIWGARRGPHTIDNLPHRELAFGRAAHWLGAMLQAINGETPLQRGSAPPDAQRQPCKYARPDDEWHADANEAISGFVAEISREARSGGHQCRVKVGVNWSSAIASIRRRERS